MRNGELNVKEGWNRASKLLPTLSLNEDTFTFNFHRRNTQEYRRYSSTLLPNLPHAIIAACSYFCVRRLSLTYGFCFLVFNKTNFTSGNCNEEAMNSSKLLFISCAAMQPVSGVLPTRGRGRGPWKKDGQQEISELRRPHALPGTGGSKSGTDVPPPDPGAKGDSVASPSSSRLSADAKEFIPKSYNVEQFEEAGGGGDAYSDAYLIPEHLSEIFLLDVIDDMTLNPGHYNSSVGILTDLLLKEEGNVQVYQHVVDNIVEKSIILPNFRYNGARLLCHFRNALSTDFQPDFRKILLRRCQDENQALMKNTSVNSQRSQGFAMFLAELFIQMEVTAGKNNRIAILGAALFEVMQTLLSVESCENIKSVCQVLKLAGLALDEQDTRTMDAVFERLTEIQNTYEREDTVRLITSVIKLRQNAWRPPSLLHTLPPCGVEKDGSHFYLPNGDALSPEESRFLQDNIEPSDDFDDYSEEIAMCIPFSNDDAEDGEDDDFDKAYEAFLAFSRDKKKSS